MLIMVMMMILVILIVNHGDSGGDLFVYVDQDITGCFFLPIKKVKKKHVWHEINM